MRSRELVCMRSASWMIVAIATVLAAGCGQPAFVSCPAGEDPCASGCVDLRSSLDDCGVCGNACEVGMRCAAGACVVDVTGACAVNNGGCSIDALCMDLGAGSVACACRPGFTGTGIECAACTACGAEQFVAAPCNPVMDAVCVTCTSPCNGDTFEVQPCGPVGDRVCLGCTPCGPSQYVATPCGGAQDTQCASCAVGCTACTGPGATCTACDLGLELVNGMCVVNPAACRNGVVELGEACDDGNTVDGDGCSFSCTVELGSYCFGEAPSRCFAGACDLEPATALPLGPAFAIDGVGTVSAAGLLLTQRSTIHTTTDVAYPMMIEADVVYSASDLTFIGARGSGLRVPGDADEPTDSLRARLSSTVELVGGATVLDSVAAPFTPTPGVPYRVRYIDDGAIASVEWFNLTTTTEGIGRSVLSMFHGSADRAFVGGGDQGGLTVSNLRVCSAPTLPVTAGLAAHYTAIPSWTAIQDLAGNVSQWQDLSGNAHHLDVNGASPVFAPGLLGGHSALDFGGAARLSTTPFPLGTDVTVFALLEHRVPAQWGAIAHHGSRDTDWSMEQSGFAGANVMHWQTNNDNTDVELTLVPGTRYVLTGRFAGTTRYFSAATLDGTAPTFVELVDASHTITGGDKPLFVGTSDAGEASNAAIGELVYFDRALTDTERDQVLAYLRSVWRP